jgi:SAM-dependent methyltransferase
MNYQKIVKCRVSKKKDLVLVGKFKGMSLTGIFPKKINQKIPYFPFEVVYSKKSQLLQLKHNYNPNLLYGNSYGYMSRLNPVMVEHLKKKSKILKKKINLKKNDFILDIGSNDGTFLNFFNGLHSYAVDPSISKLKKNYNKNIKKIPFIFEKGFTFIKKKKFKFISAIAMFYDLKDPIDFMNKIKKILRNDGIFHIEVAYLPEIIKRFSYDTFCQEHYEYYSMLALKFLCNKTNMKIVDFGFNNINGGSIWLNIAHQNSAFKSNSKKIKKQILLELKEKINKPETYKKYFKKVLTHGNEINSIIKKINAKGKNIYALGASTKGNVILQNAKLDNTLIKGVFDVNKKKFNKFTPHSKIKILDEKKIKNLKVDYILLLIWHFNKFIINKIKKLNRNIKIIIPFPKIKII